MCEDLKKHPNIVETFDYLFTVDENLFVSGIEEIFYSVKIENKIYDLLNRLNNGSNFFITTNIDRCFQNYLGLEDEKVSIYPNFNKPPKLINYLHGRIDESRSWVFTTAKYNEAYVKKSYCKNFLKDIFENYNVLFIGYGLKEEDILKTILLTDKTKTHYWIESSYRNKENDLKIKSTSLKENYNVILVPYYIDIRGHELLYNVIDSLSNKIDKKRGRI